MNESWKNWIWKETRTILLKIIMEKLELNIFFLFLQDVWPFVRTCVRFPFSYVMLFEHNFRHSRITREFWKR